MTDVSDAIHEHHQELMTTLTAHVAAIVEGHADADPAGLVTFLQRDLLPHASSEEQYLYPALDSLVKAHGRPTATMSVDHEFIEGYIRQIAEATAAMRTAAGRARPAALAHLQRLCLKLEALMELHLEKEERIYMPLFANYLPEVEQQRILEGMHETLVEPPEALHLAELDLRTLLPAQRHKWIFDTFAALEPGESFVVVSDQDTRPLYYEFQATWRDRFTWDDLEDGPVIWRAQIGQPGAAASGIDPGLIILVR